MRCSCLLPCRASQHAHIHAYVVYPHFVPVIHAVEWAVQPQEGYGEVRATVAATVTQVGEGGGGSWVGGAGSWHVSL